MPSPLPLRWYLRLGARGVFCEPRCLDVCSNCHHSVHFVTHQFFAYYCRLPRMKHIDVNHRIFAGPRAPTELFLCLSLSLSALLRVWLLCCLVLPSASLARWPFAGEGLHVVRVFSVCLAVSLSLSVLLSFAVFCLCLAACLCCVASCLSPLSAPVVTPEVHCEVALGAGPAVTSSCFCPVLLLSLTGNADD